jgi:hypothetical protein
MINTIKENLFCNSIRKRAVELELENKALKAQLEKKQEHINETNKYWKKKLHEVKRKVNYVTV